MISEKKDKFEYKRLYIEDYWPTLEEINKKKEEEEEEEENNRGTIVIDIFGNE